MLNVDRLDTFIAEGRLIRNRWRDKDGEGRERACLLAALVRRLDGHAHAQRLADELAITRRGADIILRSLEARGRIVGKVVSYSGRSGRRRVYSVATSKAPAPILPARAGRG